MMLGRGIKNGAREDDVLSLYLLASRCLLFLSCSFCLHTVFLLLWLVILFFSSSSPSSPPHLPHLPLPFAWLSINLLSSVYTPALSPFLLLFFLGQFIFSSSSLSSSSSSFFSRIYSSCPLSFPLFPGSIFSFIFSSSASSSSSYFTYIYYLFPY